ncbi:MAG: hypothetical protein ABIQ72_03460 [Usitatibacter sp.]
MPGPAEIQIQLIADICAIAERPFVEVVENNFAGHFNELQVTIKLRPESTDEEVIGLQNELLTYLESVVNTPALTWLVKFMRGDEKLRSIFPGDKTRGPGESVEWTQ